MLKILAALAPLTLGTLAYGQAFPNSDVLQDGKSYVFRSALSGKCFDIQDHSLVEGGKLQQWDCHGGSNQTFKAGITYKSGYILTPLESGIRLQVSDNNLDNGADVVQSSYAAGNNGYFFLVPESSGSTYIIRANHSGKCLQAEGSGTENGQLIVQEDCNGSRAQSWTRALVAPAQNNTDELIDGNAYRVLSKLSGKALDITDWSLDAGVQLQQWEVQLRQPNQQFYVKVLDNNTITLTSVYSHMSVIAHGTQNGAPVIQQDIVTGVEPQISVTRLPDHSYQLKFSGTGKCLDVTDVSTADGARIQQWDCHGGDNQVWILNRVID